MKVEGYGCKCTVSGFYTLTEAAAALGLSRPGAEFAAKAEGWEVLKVGNTNLYRADDIHEYRDHRQRTELAKRLGWKGRGLYRAGDIDTECPICGAFAIEWPAPPEISNKFRCLEGHEEKIL